MAVKVMVARAIANGEIARNAPVGIGAQGSTPARRRRRSAVYDAEGNEVFITLMCLKCHKMRPLAQFGLRRMADGAVRNQPWCRTCRSAAGAEQPRRKEAAEIAESLAAAASLAAPPLAPHGDGAASRRTGALAAEVAAALAAGLRR
jgi:hypothetical protein